MTIVEGYLLDTTIVSASWDLGAPRHSDVRQRLENLDGHPIYVSAVSIGEVEYGLQVAPGIDFQRQAAVRNAIESFSVLEITQHVARIYAEARSYLFRKYSPRDRRGRLTQKYIEDLVERTTGKELGIQENDLWIVSIAVEHNLIFVTNERMSRAIEATNYSEPRACTPPGAAEAADSP